MDGDGEGSLVKGGEQEALLSGDGLNALVGMDKALLKRSYMFM